MGDAIQALCVLLGSCSGVSLIIWTSTQAQIARIKAEAEAARVTAAPMPGDAVLAEIKAMRQQMEQMQSTSHEFDISFDAALSRLEQRVSRVEAKGNAAPVAPFPSEEVQQIGLR